MDCKKPVLSPDVELFNKMMAEVEDLSSESADSDDEIRSRR